MNKRYPRIILLIAIYAQLFILTSFNIYAAEPIHNKYAVLIGISNYQDPRIPDIRTAEADVDLMKSTLINDAFFKPKNIITLVNEKARLSNIHLAMEQLTKKLLPLTDENIEDKRAIVFFYFSGHGTVIRNPLTTEPDLNDEYLLPWDARSGEKYTYFRDDELADGMMVLDKLGLDLKKIIVLDACYQGGEDAKGITAFIDRGGKQAYYPEAVFSETDDLVEAGILMSASNGTSIAYQGNEYSRYTKTFCDLLGRPKNEYVRLKDIQRWLEKKVGIQEPVMLASNPDDYQLVLVDKRFGYLTLAFDPQLDEDDDLLLDNQSFPFPVIERPIRVRKYALKVYKAGYRRLDKPIEVKPGYVGNNINVSLSKETGKVIGRVIDRVTREPIEGAVAQLKFRPEYEDRFEILRSRTDKEGNFTITAPPMRYRGVIVSKTKYLPDVVPEIIAVKLDQVFKLEKSIELSPDPGLLADVNLINVPIGSTVKLVVQDDQGNWYKGITRVRDEVHTIKFDALNPSAQEDVELIEVDVSESAEERIESAISWRPEYPIKTRDYSKKKLIISQLNTGVFQPWSPFWENNANVGFSYGANLELFKILYNLYGVNLTPILGYNQIIGSYYGGKGRYNIEQFLIGVRARRIISMKLILSIVLDGMIGRVIGSYDSGTKFNKVNNKFGAELATGVEWKPSFDIVVLKFITSLGAKVSYLHFGNPQKYIVRRGTKVNLFLNINF